MKNLQRAIELGVFAAGLTASACGGGDDSPASLAGTIHGQSYSIQDAISSPLTYTTPGGRTINEALIALSTTGNACDGVSANTVQPNEQDIFIELTDFNGTAFGTPTAPGTYTIYTGNGTEPPNTAFFRALVVDGTCTDVPAKAAAGSTGTVTLAAITGNVFAGSFDVMLDSGDHVTGTFDPEACPALETPSTTPPTCR